MNIAKTYKLYQKFFNINLPELNGVDFINNSGSWTCFHTDDLYNKKYKLYIDNSLLFENDMFAEQILFHEFTHLADSIRFNHYDYKNFQNVMISYSEFHASRNQMLKCLSEISNQKVSLDSIIITREPISIRNFLKNSFESVKNSLTKMEQNTKGDPFFNTNFIFYFYGYLSALKGYDIFYAYDLSSIGDWFMVDLLNLEMKLLSDTINPDEIASLYLDLAKSAPVKTNLNSISEDSFSTK